MDYYKPCAELTRCNELIDEYFLNGKYRECFEGHLPLAEAGYPLAECQVGYFYWQGLGVEKNMDKALYWTRRGAQHGDWDAQYNLGYFYENGLGLERNMEQAKLWYRRAAAQRHDEALARCKELGIEEF